ncbi:hypothetical protein [Mesorhizobium sp. CO1-1-8]|uniref:hypothetical protein n=1 Tax=Mesorhizobium sp. CO1-1-8 TaxID=2876631 RepID=UPI001CD0A64A|nr:hypothetical protein [Mesorhizobium sp. CO1-1-8]MBZ9772597.1 hypothetical protein [Mesorhizobium sp. CO1-1-8]
MKGERSLPQQTVSNATERQLVKLMRTVDEWRLLRSLMTETSPFCSAVQQVEAKDALRLGALLHQPVLLA